MVVIPAGNFMQGSPDNERDRKSNEGPQRRVTIARPFALARTEMTIDQFRAFVNATGYTPTSTTSGSSTVYDERTGAMSERQGVDWKMNHSGNPAGGNLPVVHISWTDAKAYVDWLAKETGKSYRLPSESEYEYAQRAGSSSMYPWGNDEPDRVVGNLTGEDDRSATGRKWVNAFDNYDDGHWGPAPVRTFEANRFGLYDMVGNVSEWVEDCWHENYQRAPTDGAAWVNEGCNRRVIRGASWASAPDQVRSAVRLTAGASYTNPRLGFRVARDM
nr:formylglycine-generating enzyme family protein [Pseudomarimonas arenosa]